jgi:hypothetical protein
MIRRDYLLRLIEEFVAVVTRVAGLTNAGKWEEASGLTNSQFKALAGADVTDLLRMSETEFIARLAEGDTSFGIREKIFMTVRLFKENGDVLKAQGKIEESRACYLKGLRLLLDSIASEPTALRPDFLPSVEAFLIGLGDSPLNLETNAMLMRHFEQMREFGKAEDILFNMLDAEPTKVELLDFGIGFYGRLLRMDDETLELGNLPRTEVGAGLSELERRRSGLMAV